MKLQGRVAIVTGAAGGIGRAYVRRLVEEGAAVVVADQHEASAREVADRYGRGGGPGRALGLHVDVADEDSTRRVARETLDAFGRIDILVNNAALFSALEYRPIDEIPIEEWDAVMAVNLRGLFLCCRAVLPAMKQQRYGRIVNIGSGIILNPPRNFLHYVTSKGGVLAFTRALSRELGQYGVTVNTLSPGLTVHEAILRGHAQEQIERSRAARSIQRDEVPEDLAGALVFLASDDSAFVTGQTLVVNGGQAFS